MTVLLAAAAPKLEEIFRSAGGQTPGGGVDKTALIALACGIGGVMLLVLFTGLRKKPPAGMTPLVKRPRRLRRELRHAARIQRHEWAALREAAKRQNVDEPLLLILCPSRLPTALRRRVTGLPTEESV